MRRFRAGDRVAATQRYHICGACRYCRGGYEPLSADRRFLGQQGLVGGYAEYVAVEEDNVAVIPAGVSEEQAAIARGAIRPGISGVESLRNVGAVHARIERGGVAGRIVVRPEGAAA